MRYMTLRTMAVTGDWDDEINISTHELGSKHPTVTRKKVLRGLTIVARYYDAHGSDEK